MSADVNSWTWLDGTWRLSSVPIITADTHAFQLASSVFDGSRDGCRRVVSDEALACEPGRLGRGASDRSFQVVTELGGTIE